MSSKNINFWRVAPCLATILVDYMGLGLVYPVVTAMFTQVPAVVFPHIEPISLRDFYMGLAYLLYPLFMFFGASILGDLSDVYGRKRVILLSVGGILISFLMMAEGIHKNSIGLFLAGRGFSGLMAGSQPLCMAAVADISTKENKAWSMSLVLLTNCIGLVFGPFLAGVFTEPYFLAKEGYPFPFIIAAAFSALVLILVGFFFKETFGYQHRETKVNVLRPVQTFVSVCKDKKIFLIILMGFINLVGLMLYYQTMGIFLREKFSYSSATLGFFYGYLGIFFGLGILVLLPYFLKRIHLTAIIAWFFVIMAVSEFISILYQNQIYIWILAIPFTLFHAAGYTALATLLSNSVDERNQGKIMGVLASGQALAFILAGFSTNLLPHIGSVWVIIIGAIFSLASALLMFYGKERKWYANS